MRKSGDAQTRSDNKHQRKRQVERPKLAESVRVQRADDKIGRESDGYVFKRNRAEDPPETRPECVTQPRPGEKRKEIGAEYPDPEEDHGAAWSGRDVNDPKDEPNMNELRRGVGKAELPPAARQSVKTRPAQPRD